MMEILEKLPGITIERYTVMERSYTFAGFESFKSRRNVTLSKDSTYRKDKKNSLRRNSASSRENTVLNEKMSNDITKPASREFLGRTIKENPIFRHEVRPSSQRGSKIELEVLGKNPESFSNTSLSTFNEEEKNMQQGDTFSSDPPPPLKSILKRPGSGLSIKSCNSVGVMSLDSGMARLAASLLSHKTRKTGKHKENHGKLQSLMHGNHTISNVEESKNPELSTLPLLGSKSNQESQHLSKELSSMMEDTRTITLSPSKSVSFKLDPEIKETEGLPLKNRRGDAKWGVAFSSYQEQTKRDHSKTSDDAKSQNFRNRTNRIPVSTVHRNRAKKDLEILKSYKTVEAVNKKVALVRPHVDEMYPLTQIHRLSDPYRKYLITRATEPTQRYPYEYDTGNTDQSRQKILNRESSEAAAILRKAKRTFAKQASLDKQYMSVPYTTLKHNSPALPVLDSFEK